MTSPAFLLRAALAGFIAAAPAAAEPAREKADWPGVGPVQLSLPGLAHPAPLVVLLPNWHAVEGRIAIYTAPLNAAGIATLALDTGTDATMTEARMAKSLAALLRTAEADSRFDGKRIGILGLGIGARAALAGGTARPVAAITPGCAPLPAGPRGPVLLLTGTDVTQPEPACAELQAALGPDATHHAYPGATFAWEFATGEWWDSVLWLPASQEGLAEPAATAYAAERVARFMIEALRPAQSSSPRQAGLR